MNTPWHRFPRGQKKTVRDFHRPRYGNPLFSAGSAGTAKANAAGRRTGTGGRPRKPGEGLWVTAHPFLTALIALTVGAAWYAFWGPAFRITSVEFSGASESTKETLEAALEEYRSKAALLVFPRNNVLLFSEGGATEAIAGAVYLDGMDIKKKLPDTLVVDVQEKSMRAVLEANGKLFAVDDAGFVLRELTGRERDQMPDLPPGFGQVSTEGLGAEAIIVPTTPVEPDAAPTADAAAAAADEDAVAEEPPPPPRNEWPLLLAKEGSEKAKKAAPGVNVFSPDTIGTVLQAYVRLPDVTGEGVRWFTPDEASDSVDVTLSGGWHAYFATTSAFEVQSDRLSVVLREKIATQRPQLEYVDLRYNERVFFRLKDRPQ